MKKLIIFLLVITPCSLFAQIGIKAGVNFAQISKASEINSSTRSGFHAGIFLAPASKKIITSRTELLYSRQGYDYKSSTKTGNVDLDYFMQAQLVGINITRFVQLQFGAQTAILLNAKVDSTGGTGSAGANPYGKILDLYNRFDYGYALGAEIHPIMGLVIGARYNVSLNKVYKDIQSFQRPSFTSADAKNNVVMVSVGWRFGKTGREKKKNDNE
ncbi:MAG: PorT family protein [Flavobacterium sp.]|nr:PorT family protein [Pedobacter sp.]